MEINDTIGIPNYDEEELAVSDNVETTKFLCWDIPSENVTAAKNVLGGGAILTACCAGFCLIGINPVDAVKFVLRIK